MKEEGKKKDRLDLPFETGLESEEGTTYLALQLVGRGGNAETYLAVASSGPQRGIFFALKIFRRLSQPEWRRAFLREGRFLRDCNHPAIMRVYDEGNYLGEHPFVIAEFLPQTLRSILRSEKSIVDRLAFALQLISALGYLAKSESFIATLNRKTFSSRGTPVSWKQICGETIMIRLFS